MPNRPGQRLTVVTTCRARDQAMLEITARQLAQNVPMKSLQVIAPRQDCAEISSRLGTSVSVIPEDDFIPGMTPAALRCLKRPHFPHGAGWYFQQFLKLQFAFQNREEDYYLIWDADTVPLRPMEFFDKDGRMLLTRAGEFHPPYFDTYQRLLREDSHREFSCIAQHMLIQKSVAREMLGRIEQLTPGQEPWAWKLMHNLPAEGNNLFSEYETYGHYLKNHHPDRVRFIERSWLREGSQYTRGWLPGSKDLRQLSEQYDYVAFERVSKGWLEYGVKRLKRLVRSNP